MNIPQEATEAAAHALHGTYLPTHERGQTIAGIVLAEAIPHLLPGLFVTHEPLPSGLTLSTIWQDMEAPLWPRAMLGRTSATAALFDAIAALLPDRTNDTEG